MPQDVAPTPTAGRQRSRAAFDFGHDRERAFRLAKRHTVLVRSLRVVLPLSAFVMFVGYGFLMQRTMKFSWGDKKIEAKGITINRERLVIVDPRYTGFDKQGGEFEVRAATAEQDHKLKGFVRLNGIDGRLWDASRTATTIKSPRGTMDTNTNVLELYERIDVVSDNGMSAELTRATVFSKENRIISDEPVLVRIPSGTVRGKAMTIEQKKRHVLFTGGVVASLKPQPKASAAASPAAHDLRGSQQQGAQLRSDAPVDVTSERLFIDDATKLATFTGTVVAKQGDQVLETAELEIAYDGQPQAAAVQPAPGAAADGTGRLRRLVSKTDVVLTRGLERATGSAAEFDAVNDRAVLSGPVVLTAGPERGARADRAEIDNKADTILLLGEVVVTQQRNVMKGRRLLVDRKQGTVSLSAPAGGGLPAGQIHAQLYQSDNPAAPGKKAAPPAAPPGSGAPGGVLGSSLKSDPNQPIEIDADRLDVDDKKKSAVFRGKVKAVQGDYVIHTEELVTTYVGDGGLALAGPQPVAAGPQGQAKGAGQAKGGAQLKEVIAPRRVEIVAKDGQRARGNSAVFDPKSNTARLSGDVVLSHGTSVTNGNCAELNMGSGLMRIVDACGYASAGATSGGAPAPKGRAQLVIQPGMMKEEHKAGRDKAKSEAQPAAPVAAPAPAAAQRPPARRPVLQENDLPAGFGGN